MRTAFHYRISRTNGQRRILEHQREACRWVDNETLATRTNAWEHEQRTVDWYETTRALPLLKDTRPSLQLVHSQVVQNVTERVALACNAFFRRGKAGEAEVGYPRCKGRGRYDRITSPQYGNGVRLDGDRRIRSNVGAVHVVLHRPVEGTPKTVPRTRSRTGKGYACCSCAVEPNPLPATDAVVGVDVGLSSFATRSTGDEIANPRCSRRDEADLKRVQKLQDAAKHAQRWDENRRRKTARAHIHARIANRRSTFAHQRRRELVTRYQAVVVADLAPMEMGRSRGMRNSILDVAWTQFISMTVAKAEEAGRRVMLVNPRNTSTLCSSCGELVQQRLSDRIHTCPPCGLVMGRDHTAARTMLQRGLPTPRLEQDECGAAYAEAQALGLGSRHRVSVGTMLFEGCSIAKRCNSASERSRSSGRMTGR